ncbi:hypothetical protein DCAR_0414785 [Daucus carota subsp. sativus]|uniref:VLRF1 domain-containing protein n=1 Tax=Daucus carota subsp. sativus TaxID=79200 RepID=A0AAF0WV69_DAUCS|nr:PREDICTED: ankyrin repeat and zinc finger domain-containing protein 1 [Daucus carota subsp. sativus]WOG95466.1 hypothetical protein DCAR_0414785 [Daucus carota subsp. sativus]
MSSELRIPPIAAATPALEKRHRSIFELPQNYFSSCRLLQSPTSIYEPPLQNPKFESLTLDDSDKKNSMQKWTCNTCKTEFESLQDQRGHFKSDLHRFNIKLSVAGKDIVKEEDFDESTSDALFKDFDVSSISGSDDDDDDRTGGIHKATYCGVVEGSKRKLYLHLQTGGTISVWRNIIMDESQRIAFENDKPVFLESDLPHFTEKEVIEKLNNLIHEPRNNTHFRIVLLARGGHFAGCVFDGNSVVTHKTFHRYVIRAGAGKKQSSKDASGKIAHSAGSSIRRYNELALKKEIQELLVAWKPYFEASSCIFVHAPSSNRQLIFDGEKPYLSWQHHSVRTVPLTVRRPTFKEAKRLYSILTQVSDEADDLLPILKEDSKVITSVTTDSHSGCREKDSVPNNLDSQEGTEPLFSAQKLENVSRSSESESESQTVLSSTPLHEAAKSNDANKIMELLEEGLDPCIKDERGRTPYMLATEKEVRNTFRRFMASNIDKWDWNAAKVPSPLTKEMEEAQNAKQAEKDAKRKARAKELKKLKKAKEKKAQAEAAAQAKDVSSVTGAKGASSSSSRQSQVQATPLSREEELRKAQAAEREKRAAAAERRLAAAAASKDSVSNATPSNSSASNTLATDATCSCCSASLAGKVPFHRYSYKYCSTSCMFVHKEIIEDG